MERVRPCLAGGLARTLITLTILLRPLYLLRWHERVTIWEPAHTALPGDGDPYVPSAIINAGRYRPTGRIRIADYPDPYPARVTKVVTVETLGVLSRRTPPCDEREVASM